jgi:hypothetical protein
MKKTSTKSKAASHPRKKPNKKSVAKKTSEIQRTALTKTHQSQVKMPLSLLAVEYPEGFDETGRRLLARCPEFKLYEHYKIDGPTELITAPKIERAMLRSLLRINNSFEKGDTDERIDLAVAFLKIWRFKKRGFKGSAVPLAREVGEVLGSAMSKVLHSKDCANEADIVGKKFRDAVLAVARYEGKIPDKRSKKKVGAVAVLICEAQGQFQHQRTRPRKSHLIGRLEAIGYQADRKEWEDIFFFAGLDQLPD